MLKIARDHQAFADQIGLYFRQQIELYGEEAFWLGVETGSLQVSAAEPTLLQVRESRVVAPKKDAAPLKKIQDLRAEYRACEACGRANGRQQVVFGAGSPFAQLLILSGVPARAEDTRGMPFPGPTGEILDRMLKKMGFSRKEVYVTHIVKCAAGGEERPNEAEVAACRKILARQLEIIAPKYIFCLGQIAANALLGNADSLAELRQQNHTHAGAKVFVTYHPAQLDAEKKLFWKVFEDMKRFRRIYDREIGDKPPMI